MTKVKTDVIIFGFGRITNLLINQLQKSGHSILCITDNDSVNYHKFDSATRFMSYAQILNLEIDSEVAIFTWRDKGKYDILNGQLSLWISSELFITKKNIFLSSASVYQDSLLAQIETPINQSNTIEENKKIQLEITISQIMKQKSVKYLNLRISNVYGNDLEHGIIASLINSMNKKTDTFVFQNDGIIRDYVFVEDVIRAIDNLINFDIKYDVLNISTGIGTSIGEIMQIYSALGGKMDFIKSIPAPENIKKSSILDCSKLKSVIEWNPIFVDVGLKNLLLQS